MKRENELLCHFAKALRYRFTKVVAGSKDDFGGFKVGTHTRTPNEIINHMTDLATKTMTMIKQGHFKCAAPAPLAFETEKIRFVACLEELQRVALEHEIDGIMVQKLMQGPMIDMATHLGQLAMLNGLNGNRISWENYFEAEL